MSADAGALPPAVSPGARRKYRASMASSRLRIRLFQHPTTLVWRFHILTPHPKYGELAIAAGEPQEQGLDFAFVRRQARKALRREREYERKGYGPEDYAKAAERHRRRLVRHCGQETDLMADTERVYRAVQEFCGEKGLPVFEISPPYDIMIDSKRIFPFAGKPGCYVIYNADMKLLYVGTATDVGRRLGNQFVWNADRTSLQPIGGSVWIEPPRFLQTIPVHKPSQALSPGSFGN
jgi:hypothetical protein